jgi:hypothetical protein
MMHADALRDILQGHAVKSMPGEKILGGIRAKAPRPPDPGNPNAAATEPTQRPRRPRIKP